MICETLKFLPHKICLLPQLLEVPSLIWFSSYFSFGFVMCSFASSQLVKFDVRSSILKPLLVHSIPSAEEVATMLELSGPHFPLSLGLSTSSPPGYTPSCLTATAKLIFCPEPPPAFHILSHHFTEWIIFPRHTCLSSCSLSQLVAPPETETWDSSWTLPFSYSLHIWSVSRCNASFSFQIFLNCTYSVLACSGFILSRRRSQQSPQDPLNSTAPCPLTQPAHGHLKEPSQT